MNTDATAPRIPPLPMSEMREEWMKILERIPGAGLKGRYFPANVLGVLMYNPRTFGPFLDYWVTSKLEMGLTVREQELVILRMGHLFDCNYVWKHHVPVGREFGITEPELQALRADPLPAVFSPREQAFLALTDEMMEHRTIRDEAWRRWSGTLRPSDLVDLVALLSQYVLFALVNNALQVEIEPALEDVPGL